MRSKLIGIAVVLLWGNTAVPALAVDLVNGSFESGIDPGTSYVAANNADVVGWTISGGVRYVGDYWQAADESRSLDLSDSVSTVSQSFATDGGGAYAVTFSMSGDPSDVIGAKQVEISVGSVGSLLQTYVTTPNNSRMNMLWKSYFFELTALSGNTTLSFTSLGGGGGPVLDNIVLFDVGSMPSPVPEPTTWTLFGIGFTMLGMSLRRSTPRHVPLRVSRTV